MNDRNIGFISILRKLHFLEGKAIAPETPKRRAQAVPSRLNSGSGVAASAENTPRDASRILEVAPIVSCGSPIESCWKRRRGKVIKFLGSVDHVTIYDG